MLNSLSIKNIALIKSAEISFQKGLNVLTGETGAGKSILIDSLGFALGDRADKTLIRHGSEKASVEAVFNSSNITSELFDEYGIEIDDEIIITRDLTTAGTGTIRVNGTRVVLGVLQKITSQLCAIYGQHEAHEIFDKKSHLGLLDQADSKIEKQKSVVAASFGEYKKAKKVLENLGTPAEILKRAIEVADNLKEIASAKLIEGEEETLKATRKKLDSLELYASALASANEALSGFDIEENATSLTARAMKELASIAELEPELDELVERLESVKIELSDISNTVGSLLSDVDFDEGLAQKTYDRIDFLRAICKKFGVYDSDELIELQKNLQQEYLVLQKGEDAAHDAQKALELAEKALLLECEKLTKIRKTVAKTLTANLVKDLAEVSLAEARVEVEFLQVKPTANGADDVTFMVSFNKGQPLKPLTKTISGGEASRFMLCLKCCLEGIGGVSAMVFDEVDTGISGETSKKVAQKLKKIAQNKQVLCVTHLPQPAALSDAHFKITKTSTKDQTETSITQLNTQSSIEEIARLIAGDDKSATAMAAAREMKRFVSDQT